jgi:poly-gamma-glutamate synthase PgsB/CapB
LDPILLFLLLSAVWVVYLVAERLRLERDRKAIPLRIAVTGTRGKTSVARLLAAVLRADGRKVLAKTTGSEALYILPDGTEQEIRRRGAPSIIEQKGLLRRGAQMGVDAVVAEIMSVHAENHRVEAQAMLRPHLVLVTNFRVDHPAAQGDTSADVARVLSLDVPVGARVFVLQEGFESAFGDALGERNVEVVKVPHSDVIPPEGCAAFGPNLDLVWAVARALGVGEPEIREGVCQARGDIGALRVWRYPRAEAETPWRVVNAFAANDPDSTLLVYDRVMAEQGHGPQSCVGLLNLRADRGDRTLQWVESLQAGALERFQRLYVYGLHSRALRFRMRRQDPDGRIHILPPGPPDGIMGQVFREGDEVGGGLDETGGILFGFGNIAGLGDTLVRHWRHVGEPVPGVPHGV